MSTNGYLISNSGSVTVVMNGQTYNIGTDHANYKNIIDALRDRDYDTVYHLIDIGKTITEGSDGKLTVKDGFIYNGDYIVDNSLTRRILDLMRGDFPFDPLMKFLENLLQNPSARAIQEAYSFLDVNTLPITEDGCFLAYKRVRDDYFDLHSGTILNKVGARVEMERSKVNDDKDQTCSYGLHACSLSYLSEFCAGQGHIMILKINPKDIVSVPRDYNNSKLRCCAYDVIGEHVIDESKDCIIDKFNKPVYASDGTDYTPRRHDKRGADGKFISADHTGHDIDMNDDVEVDDDYDCNDCGDCVDCSPDVEDDLDVQPVNPVKKPRRKYGRKPDGTRYHNRRDASGKFC